MVDPGQELFSFDYENSDPENGVVHLNDNTGLIEEGDEVWLSSSALPQTGSVAPAAFENGQLVYNGPRDTPDGYQTWGSGYRQISFGASVGSQDSSTYLGGAYYIPEEAPTLVADKIDQVSSAPLLPVESDSWTFDISNAPAWMETATVAVDYYSDAPGAPNQGFMHYELGNKSLSNGFLTVTDDVLPLLSQGDFYFVTFTGEGEGEYGSVYMGLYGELPEPTTEPTEEPTTEPTVDPTTEPTEEPTTEPTVDPTTEPTEEPTTEPTSEPTSEPTADPTTEPTEEPTTEPTVDPTTEPTTEPTVDPTTEPTTEPTADPTTEPTTEPTADPTTEPTSEPTADPTTEPTSEPTADPTTEPTSEPTDVPEAQQPESGAPVEPEDQKLTYDEDSSDPSNNKYVFNINDDVEDGDITVTYSLSPDTEPKTTKAKIIRGQLVIEGNESFATQVEQHHELLITIQDKNGENISAVVAGASTLSLVSELADQKLGVPLAAAGIQSWDFAVPAGFPEMTDANYNFSVKYRNTQDIPVELSNMDYAINGGTLTITDDRVAKISDGTYYLYGEPVSNDAEAANGVSHSAATVVGSVSTWFGVYTPAVVEPTATAEPTSSPEPSETPEVSQTPEQSPSESTTPSEDAPQQSKDPKDKDLAETGASTGLITAGVVALGLIVIGAVSIGLRRGRHS